MWLKVLDIVHAESFDVVLILDGIRIMRIFVVGIGALMNESGIFECLQTEFGTNTVQTIIDGKAISRAIRAHFPTEGSLMAKLLATFVSAKNSEVKEAEENGEMNDMDPDDVN